MFKSLSNLEDFYFLSLWILLPRKQFTVKTNRFARPGKAGLVTIFIKAKVHDLQTNALHTEKGGVLAKHKDTHYSTTNVTNQQNVKANDDLKEIATIGKTSDSPTLRKFKTGSSRGWYCHQCTQGSWVGAPADEGQIY